MCGQELIFYLMEVFGKEFIHIKRYHVYVRDMHYAQRWSLVSDDGFYVQYFYRYYDT